MGSAILKFHDSPFVPSLLSGMAFHKDKIGFGMLMAAAAFSLLDAIKETF